jgi:hypothetical protein
MGKKNMMNRQILILIFTLLFSFVKATEQVPDILYYNSAKLTLTTDWKYPSPLELYFSQNKIKYPFSWISTANYRGHIAVWVIDDNKLFLKEIDIFNIVYKPEDYNIKSKNDSVFNDNNYVFADWFSGILECEMRNPKNYWEVIAKVYFEIHYGKVIDDVLIIQDSFFKLENDTSYEISENGLIKKCYFEKLYENYKSYYFRLGEKDTVMYNNKSGYIFEVTGLSPILLYYSNEHLKWPYNWENIEKNGAPNCKWEIIDKKIYLTEINLFSGIELDSIVKDTISLTTIFEKKVIDERVFGDWITGILIIKHGYYKKKDYGYLEFIETGRTYLRFTDGEIEESYSVSKDFKYWEMPEETEPGLRKIIEEIYN